MVVADADADMVAYNGGGVMWCASKMQLVELRLSRMLSREGKSRNCSSRLKLRTGFSVNCWSVLVVGGGGGGSVSAVSM